MKITTWRISLFSLSLIASDPDRCTHSGRYVAFRTEVRYPASGPRPRSELGSAWVRHGPELFRVAADVGEEQVREVIRVREELAVDGVQFGEKIVRELG